MKRVHLEALRVAAATKPAGYLDDCLTSGHVEGDFLFLRVDDYRALQRRYRPSAEIIRATCGTCDQLWAPALCMYPECQCSDKARHEPWTNMIACPIRRW